MLQSYPNPFNPTTSIAFALPEATNVSMNIYDCAGQKVASLVSGWRSAGVQEVTFDGSNLASGIYICQIKASGYEASKKLVLLK